MSTLRLPCWHKSHLDTEADDFAREHGIERYAQINAHRCCDYSAQAFSEDIWAQKQYTPEQVEEDIEKYGLPKAVTALSGVPPVAADIHIMLDLEDDLPGMRTGWSDCRHPDSRWSPQWAARYLIIHEHAVTAIRRDFPDALLTIWHQFDHGMLEHWSLRRSLDRSIASLVDGNSPGAYYNAAALESGAYIDRALQTVKKSLAWKAHRLKQHGIRIRQVRPDGTLIRENIASDWGVYPTIWKIVEGTGELAPLDAARAHLRAILDLEHEGCRVDGICIFDTPQRIEGNLPFMRMVVEEIQR